jgi:hypothetical protein
VLDGQDVDYSTGYAKALKIVNAGGYRC